MQTGRFISFTFEVIITNVNIKVTARISILYHQLAFSEILRAHSQNRIFSLLAHHNHVYFSQLSSSHMVPYGIATHAIKLSLIVLIFPHHAYLLTSLRQRLQSLTEKCHSRKLQTMFKGSNTRASGSVSRSTAVPYSVSSPRVFVRV